MTTQNDLINRSSTKEKSNENKNKILEKHDKRMLMLICGPHLIL